PVLPALASRVAWIRPGRQTIALENSSLEKFKSWKFKSWKFKLRPIGHPGHHAGGTHGRLWHLVAHPFTQIFAAKI
ncbi:MAG: hypothetical protein Q7U92_04925, partial [Bradyrhizobium sp.]|nr:hypothetical protein [Bradyrhizobium sp.]